jgi:hypothetical protein
MKIKKKMFVVFIMTILSIWLASFAITYFTYYMGPDIFQVRKYDDRRVLSISAEKAKVFGYPELLGNLTREEIQVITSYPENVINITKDELKEYPALEKAINGVDCIEPSPNSSLCKAASTEDFNKIRNFIYSKLNSTVSSCFKLKKYENCYTFSFARP